MLYRYYFLCCILLNFYIVQAVVLERPGGGSKVFPHVPGGFGPALVFNSVGPLHLKKANPVSGCDPLVQDYSSSIVLVTRGNCNFTQKVYNAQLANASGVIVMDNSVNSTSWRIVMDGSSSDLSSQIKIPSVFVPYDVGLELLLVLSAGDDQAPSVVTLDIKGGDFEKVFETFSTYLIHTCVTILVLIISSLAFALLISNICEYIRLYALSSLKVRIVTEDENQECTVCLEEFVISDSVMTLPCKHEYHTDCIKQWLLTRGGKCPLCRKVALPKGFEQLNFKTDLEECIDELWMLYQQISPGFLVMIVPMLALVYCVAVIQHWIW